ncbi:hypothetical protein [Bacillus sp. FJAT-49736]|uniref:hypothetical protein n=1 Tax=Bacillus sp. FJAT-49736 TaxID=2833582 RepID=UPI001BC9C1C1|nr:hypothetical protein [Bacillus sp. FJAT-49736]MBS4172191.1 hypothetical protein [Bacillus sp. FJAT-49736]
MRKSILVFLSIFIILSMIGCSKHESVEKKTSSSEKVENDTAQNKPKKKSKYPFPADIKQKGTVDLEVINTVDGAVIGKVPIFNILKTTKEKPITLDYYDFDATNLTFIYVDGVFVSTESFGKEGKTPITIKDDDLTPGTHTVTAVQFAGLDPNGEVEALAQAKYKIKVGN